ncbi:Gfo/Idh/MocA family protein [Ktedonosporobacter rubrisoli]|uniref:Gfo/Idh/MocA family protein n=1 Tax=Ktedonosporobacter rubrisoli TaxID=2509675 RepID=UPI0013EE55EB|nr:Gfo/Idh/MocA family oxidoreductase [Ktedonosporobacter rubrisoli]
MSNPTDANHKIKVAFLGIRHPHVFVRVELAQRDAELKIVGFYEEDGEIAERFAAQTTLQRFASAEALLSTKPDLVIIEALDTQVPALALLAAPHTRALLLEKPGAPDRSSMDALVEQLAQYDIEVEVSYQLHYSESVAMCREILQAGALGQITQARFHAGCPIGCGAELWQSVPGDLGGVVYTEACHILELMVDMLGMPGRIFAAVQKLPPGASVVSDVVKPDLFAGTGLPTTLRVGELMYEDVGAAIFSYPDKLVTLDVTAWEATDWVQGWRMEFYGTNGSLSAIPNPPTVQLFLPAPVAGYRAGDLLFQGQGPRGPENSLVPDQTYERQFERLITVLRERQPASQEGLRRGQDVVHILDAIYRSAREGRAIDYPG